VPCWPWGWGECPGGGVNALLALGGGVGAPRGGAGALLALGDGVGALLALGDGVGALVGGVGALFALGDGVDALGMEWVPCCPGPVVMVGGEAGFSPQGSR